MYNKKYLSKRPFMMVFNTYRPAKGVNTTKAGWADMNDESWSVFENVNFVDRVKEKDLVRAVVIIDVLEATVVKNSFKDVKADNVMKHYLTKYRAETTEAVGLWMEKEAQERARAGLPALDIKSDAPSAQISAEDLASAVTSVITKTGGSVEDAKRALGQTTESKPEVEHVEAEEVHVKPKRKTKSKVAE
jgi:hypothetical protein